VKTLATWTRIGTAGHPRQWWLGPANTAATAATEAIFSRSKAATSMPYLPYRSEWQRRCAEEWPRPFGLHPKCAQPALLAAHLDCLNFSPRALSGHIWGSNVVVAVALTGPRYLEKPLITSNTL
jgi:hypothetical protein